MSKLIYSITVQPEAKFLLITFPHNPELFTQAAHLREIELKAKEIIHLRDGVPLEDIELEISHLDEDSQSRFINRKPSFLKFMALHPSPSADGKI